MKNNILEKKIIFKNKDMRQWSIFSESATKIYKNPPKKFKNVPTVFPPKKYKNPPKNINMPLKNTKSSHQNQISCFGIFREKP